MDLHPGGGDIAACETDFVLIAARGTDRRIQIAIGECKTHRPIEQADVANLMRVARAFPEDRYAVFLVFSKLADFSPDELDLIRQVNVGHRRRAIVLTTRELEPWQIYENVPQGLDVSPFASSLSDLADATEQIFLAPSASSAVLK